MDYVWILTAPGNHLFLIWTQKEIINIFLHLIDRDALKHLFECNKIDHHAVPVLTACQPIENGVLACTMYSVTGLWLSGPGPHESRAVLSVMSPTSTPTGAPGGPDNPPPRRDKKKSNLKKRYSVYLLKERTNKVTKYLAMWHKPGCMLNIQNQKDPSCWWWKYKRLERARTRELMHWFQILL